MEKLTHLIKARLDHLPWYVTEFTEYKGRTSTERTLLSYCTDIEQFFQWLINEGFYVGERKDITLDILESLRVQNIVSYESFCKNQLDNGKDTIARKVSSLKSLFHYLSQIAEDEDLYPYIKRNVLAKIDVVKEQHTETERAEHISSRILVDQEIESFREFIALGYGETVKETNERKYNSWLMNRERDLALISLILGSGLRVSEVVQLDIDKVDWNNGHVLVKRKGDKFDKVSFSDIAMQDLREYKKVRQEIYKATKTERALFLSTPGRNNDRTKRLSKNMAQKMVKKYADAFGKGAISIHKLRHTFATNHYKHNKDIASLRRQLGHSNINTTMIYTHVFDTTLSDSVNNADK